MNYKKGKKDEGSSRADESNASLQYIDQVKRSRETTGREANEISKKQNLEKSTTESGLRETLYLEGTDLNMRRQHMSPETEGRLASSIVVAGSRSPGVVRQSVISTVRNDLTGRQDTAQIVGKKPIPTLSVAIPVRKEDYEDRIERSPKTINIAGNEKEVEFNAKTINYRRSPRETTRPGPTYQTNTMTQEAGVFLDQPVGSGFIQGQEPGPREGVEIQYANDLRNQREPITASKMSPNRNTDQDSSNECKPLDNEQKLKDLRRIQKEYDLMNRQEHPNFTENIEENANFFGRFKNDLAQIEESMRKSRAAGLGTENLKKFSRQMTKGYDPNKKEGRLISREQRIISGASDQLFGSRKQVLQRMNKLSTIILSKSNLGETGFMNRSITQDEKLRQTEQGFDRSTVGPEGREKRYNLTRSPHQKFIYLSLAMLSSKGPNCEDRIIFRKMRFDKGGVVDLAQESAKRKRRFEVKKIQRKKSPPGVTRGSVMTSHPKYREKAAKIVQTWWRDILNRYTTLLQKIIKIQSVWRGRWLRRYLYDIIFITYLLQIFNQRTQGVIVQHCRKYVVDKLLGEKYYARLKLMSILKIQRNVRNFFGYKHHVQKVNNFNIGKEASEKLRDILTRNIKDNFKTFVDATYNKRIDYLKQRILMSKIKNQLKNLIRRPLMKWLRNVMKTKGTPDSLRVGMLKKSIVRPLWNDTTGKMKQLPHPRVKRQILKTLLKKADRYSDVILREYFNKWLETTRRLNVMEFKNGILGRFLFKTSKALEKDNFKRKFGKWRSILLGGKDLTPFVNGNDLLRKFCIRKVYKQTMPLDGMNGIYAKMFKFMCKDDKFKNMRLRRAFNRWLDYMRKLKELEMFTKLLISLRKRNFNRLANKVMSKRFNDWRRKAAMLKYIDETNKDDTEKKKFFGLTKIINGTEKVAKRKGLGVTVEQMKKYLDDIIRQRAVKILMMKNPKLSRIIMRNYFNKYKAILNKLRLKEFERNLFNNLLGKVGSKLSKNLMRRNLQKWWRNLPKNTHIAFFTGSDILQRAVWRRTFRDPIDAMKQKDDLVNTKDMIKKMFGIKARYIRNHWRDYLIKWRFIVQKLIDQEIQLKITSKFLNNLLKKIKMRILSNRFSHWRKAPKISMADILERFKQMCYLVNLTAFKITRPSKVALMEWLKKYKNPRIYWKAVHTIMDNFLNNNRNWQRYILYHWKDQCKNIELHDLKLRLLGFAVGAEGLKNDKKRLSSAFHKWIYNAKLNNLLKNSNRNLAIYRGADKLGARVKSRQNDFMTRLHRLMNMDFRGKLIWMLQKRLDRPRISMGRSFDRWRRITSQSKTENLISNLNNILFSTVCKKLYKRMERDKFIRAFNKWRGRLQKPEDYYLRISEGKSKLDSTLKQKYLHGPWTCIKSHTSYGDILERLLPSCKRLRARKNKEILNSRWSRWKKFVSAMRTKEWSVNILVRLKEHFMQKRKGKYLTKYFFIWANKKKRSLHFPNFVKGLEIVRKTLERPWKLAILNGLKKKYSDLTKRAGLNGIFRVSKTFNKMQMRNCLMKWWRQSLLFDDTALPRVHRLFRRVILENYTQPKEKYFRRWLRAMIEKPKDFRLYQKGADKLKSAFVQGNRGAFKKIKDHVSESSLISFILKKVMPKSKLSAKRFLQSALVKWKQQADRMKLKMWQGYLLANMYTKDKSLIRKRFLKKYFNIFAHKEPDVKPIDLYRFARGNTCLYNHFARKYMIKFVPLLVKNLHMKYLKSMLFGYSRFHLRALLPFLRRWRTICGKLKDRDTMVDMSMLLIRRMTKFRTNKNFQDVLRNRFRLWFNNAKALSGRLKSSIPKANNLLEFKSKKNTELFDKLAVNSKKVKQTEGLNKALLAGKAAFKYFLRRKFGQWRNIIKALTIRDYIELIMKNLMKGFFNKRQKAILLRRFGFWKNLRLLHNLKPITVGTETLYKLLWRRPWTKFKKIVSMMNLKIPHGMTLSEALIRMNPNIAKSIAIRNFALRPYWKKYKSKVNDLKNHELKTLIFNKIFMPNLKSSCKLRLRKGFNRWKEVVQQMNQLDMQKEWGLKILGKIYDKNNKIFLRRKFIAWKDINARYFKWLNNASLGVIKLRHHAQKPLFNKIKGHTDAVDIFTRTKKAMLYSLRKNDLGNLTYCFNKWKNNTQKLRELNLKYKIFGILVNGMDKKSEDYIKNLFHKKFLHWSLNARPKDYLENMRRYRVGNNVLVKGLRGRFTRPFYNGLKDLAKNNKVKHILYKFISDYDPKANIFLLQNAWKKWKMRLADTGYYKKLFSTMLNKYILSPRMHEAMYTIPVEDIVDSMKARALLKKNKAYTISDFCRGLLNIKKRMAILKRNLQLHKAFSNLDLKLAIKSRLLFARWMRNANIINVANHATVIQRFLRGRLDKRMAYMDRVKKFVPMVGNYMKIKFFKKLYQCGKDNRYRTMLMRLMRTYSDIDIRFFRKYLIRWKLRARELQKKAFFILIQNFWRQVMAKKLRYKLLKRKAKMNEIVNVLFGKYLDKKKIYFNKWLIDTRMHKCEIASSVIQNFLLQRLTYLKTGRAREQCRNLFRKSFITNVKDKMTRAKKVRGDRGLILYDTLKTIFIQRPFEKVKASSWWIGRMKKLYSVWPRIQKGLRFYWLPFYMKKWKSLTWDEKIRKIIFLQEWYRVKMQLWRNRCKAKKDYFVQKYFSLLTNDNELKKQLAFKLWSKKNKMLRMNNQAKTIQSIWRGNTSRKNVDRTVNRLKLSGLMRRLFLRKFSDVMLHSSDFLAPLKRNITKLKSTFDRRYVTNNIIDFGNNSLRNHYLWLLTKKRAFISGLSTLKRYFNRWKNNGEAVNSAIINIQSKYRKYLGNRIKKNILRTNNQLLKLHFKYDQTETSRLHTTFRRYQTIVNFMKLNDSSRVIQDFLRPRNARWQNNKLKSFFTDRGVKVAKRRVNWAMKMKNFKFILFRQLMRTFKERLGNKAKFERIKWIFIKKFANLDDQLISLLMGKYFRDWRVRAKRLKNKLDTSCVRILANYKTFLAKKFLDRYRNKKLRFMQIVLKLLSDFDHKKKICFGIWRTETANDRLNHAATVIQKFCNDIRKKGALLKRKERLLIFQKFLLMLGDREGMLKYAMIKLKSEAGRNKFMKMMWYLINRRKDHLRTGMDKLKSFAYDLYTKKNGMANYIQLIWFNRKQRRGFRGLIAKIRKMRLIMKLMLDRDLRFKHSYFTRWKKNAQIDNWHRSAKVIQNFCGDNILKWRRLQRIKAMEGLSKLFRNFLVNKQFRPFMKNFLGTVKFNKFNNHLGKYIFRKFLYNITNWEKLKYLGTLFKIPTGIRQKILRKWLNLWRNKAIALRKLQGTLTIQRGYRVYSSNSKRGRIQDILKKKLLRLCETDESKKKKYLRLWSGYCKAWQVNHSADVICKFVGGQWDRLKATRLWKKFSYNLMLRAGYYGALQLLKRAKWYMMFSKLFPMMRRKILTGAWGHLWGNAKNMRTLKLVTLLFGNFEKRKDMLSLLTMWRRWKNFLGRWHSKQKALSNIFDICDTRRKIIGARTISDLGLLKRMFNTIRKTRAGYALKRIQRRADNKDKLKDFSKYLVAGDNDLATKNRNLFANKIYRVYIYRLLDRLMNICNAYRKKYLFPPCGQYFLSRLNYILLSGSKYDYNQQKTLKFKSPVKTLQFKKSVANAKREQQKLVKKDPLKFTGPLLMKYLNMKRRSRIAYAYNKIKDMSKAKLFCRLIRMHSDNTLIPPKKEYLNKIKAKWYYLVGTPDLLQRLVRLLRRGFIRKVSQVLIPSSKIYRLLYLIKLTFMHRDVASKRFIRELIRKWRFISFMKKLAKKKMEAMYKNMHLSYLNMANEVFGDDQSNPSVVKEFEIFGSNMGLFVNEEPSANEEFKKQYCSKVTKKYVFEPSIIDEEKHVEERTGGGRQKDTAATVLGETTEYYIDQEIGEGTTGRYRVDTNRSGINKEEDVVVSKGKIEKIIL